VVGSYDDGTLHLEVGDDGRGGADAHADDQAGGLAGIARRLAAFDGTLEVASPPGGPTIVTMEVPCRTRP
jgi:signal transduction histidine kinase